MCSAIHLLHNFVKQKSEITHVSSILFLIHYDSSCPWELLQHNRRSKQRWQDQSQASHDCTASGHTFVSRDGHPNREIISNRLLECWEPYGEVSFIFFLVHGLRVIVRHWFPTDALIIIGSLFHLECSNGIYILYSVFFKIRMYRICGREREMEERRDGGWWERERERERMSRTQCANFKKEHGCYVLLNWVRYEAG